MIPRRPFWAAHRRALGGARVAIAGAARPHWHRATEAVVTQIDLAAGKLATSVGTVGFDELLLAAGAALAPESVPGLSEAAHGFYTREDATRLRDALVSFGGGRVLVVVAAMAFNCPPRRRDAAAQGRCVRSRRE